MKDPNEVRKRAYVIALVGGSVAVLTELVWWLVCIERYQIVGVEVWRTTHVSDEDIVPKWNLLGQNLRMESESWRNMLTIHCLQNSAGVLLSDIKTTEDAHTVTDTLGTQVRMAREDPNLPTFDTLIGGPTGGRKSMTTALMTAFSAYARRGDRLIQIWLHQELERSEDKGKFLFPTEDIHKKFGVPIDAQIIGYDIPYFQLQDLLTDNTVLHRLAQEQSLQSLFAPPHPASLVRHRSGWHLRYTPMDRSEKEIFLPPTIGRIYRVLCEAPTALTSDDVRHKILNSPHLCSLAANTPAAIGASTGRLIKKLNADSVPLSMMVRHTSKDRYRVIAAAGVDIQIVDDDDTL